MIFPLIVAKCFAPRVHDGRWGDRQGGVAILMHPPRVYVWFLGNEESHHNQEEMDNPWVYLFEHFVGCMIDSVFRYVKSEASLMLRCTPVWCAWPPDACRPPGYPSWFGWSENLRWPQPLYSSKTTRSICLNARIWKTLKITRYPQGLTSDSPQIQEYRPIRVFCRYPHRREANELNIWCTHFPRVNRLNHP